MREPARGAPGAPDFDAMGWPSCARCGGPVESVRYYYRTRGGAGEHVFVARCHGRREQAVVTELDVLEARGLDAFRFASAFAGGIRQADGREPKPAWAGERRRR